MSHATCYCGIEPELWRPVIGDEGFYDVSDHGNTRSLDRVVIRSNGCPMTCRGKLLSPAADLSDGRLMVNLRGRSRRVHQLVLEAFVGPCPPGLEGCHWDGNNQNNHAWNLRYDTRGANHRDAVRHGTHSQASKTSCPLDHALVAPNLVPSVLVRATDPGRDCLACSRTRANQQYARYKGRPFDFRATADRHYARIIRKATA